MAGDFWAFEEFVTSSKMNKMTDASQGNIAEGAYKTLAASLSFENGDSLAAEDYTSAAGANGTVNTGSTDAAFDTDHYELGSPVEEQATATTYSNQTTTGFDMTATWNAAYNGIVTSMIVTASATETVQIDIKKGAVVLASKTTSISTANNRITFVEGDYSDTFATGETVTVSIVEITSSNYGRRTGYVYSGTDFTMASQQVSTPWSGGAAQAPIIMQGVGVISPSEIVCDTNTLAVDDETNSFALHWQGDFPTDTSGSFDLISGATTINLPVDSVTKKTGVISKGALANIATMTIKQKLVSTNSAVTPTTFGWGVSKL